MILGIAFEPKPTLHVYRYTGWVTGRFTNLCGFFSLLYKYNVDYFLVPNFTPYEKIIQFLCCKAIITLLSQGVVHFCVAFKEPHFLVVWVSYNSIYIHFCRKTKWSISALYADISDRPMLSRPICSMAAYHN